MAAAAATTAAASQFGPCWQLLPWLVRIYIIFLVCSPVCYGQTIPLTLSAACKVHGTCSSNPYGM
jgi:hypothetical protein